MKLSNPLEYGLQVESHAAEWFLAHHPNSRLIARNFRCKGGELDLVFEEEIAVDSAEAVTEGALELVFVEVRARREGSWVSGLESVGFRKRLRLGRAIQHFMVKYRGVASSARCDVLAWDGRRWMHVPNVWLS